MKKVILSIAITAALALNAQGSSGTTTVSEDNKTGIRTSTAVADYHGNIGHKAVDLSYSYITSGTLGATGYVSTALGLKTTASGTSSTAMGYETTASGTSSTAMGDFTTASDYGSLVIGRHNNLGSSVTNGGSATEYSANNTAFVIGNGTDADNKSDAFTVMFNGNANLAGTLTAGSFVGDGSQLTGIGILTPVTEDGKTGYRLSTSDIDYYGDIGEKAIDLSFFDSASDKSDTRGATGVLAIAMGHITTASGSCSTASGNRAIASGHSSTAMGYETTASGTSSTAMGENTTASGWASTAMGFETTASERGSTAMGYSTTASGYFSTAMGDETTASGSRSTAMGYSTTASGWASTAMGEKTIASGWRSTAMGYETTASGRGSTAMGENTTASDFGSLVIGRYNNLGSSVSSNGSATEYSANNTAFVIGNGTDADNKSDAFTVMFNGDVTLAGTLTAGSFAGNGSQLTGIGILTPVTEDGKTGYRLSTSNAANHGNIGSNAVDLSYSNGTSGTRGATGDRATAMGEFTTASGTSSTAMGDFTTASDYGSLVIGRYNNLGSSVSSNGSATSYNANNTAFVIGNGTAADNKSDAFTVMFNGDVTLAGNLAVNSDARLKANIISLGGTLSKLLKIDGKKYTKKKDKNQKLNIGVLAQDIEKVFPELVSESNGIKSVNYQGLVPVLINALKEQDSRMKDQETKLNKQQEEINELKAIVKKLL